jgi:hypothetical protein
MAHRQLALDDKFLVPVEYLPRLDILDAVAAQVSIKAPAHCHVVGAGTAPQFMERRVGVGLILRYEFG